MKHKIFIFLILIFYKHSNSENAETYLAKLPRLEISSNIGIVWVIQGNLNLNINDRVYLKYRKSASFLSLDDAFMIGYQEIYSPKGRYQFGIGYSKGHVDPFVIGGPNIDDITEYWRTITLEVNFINYLSFKISKFGLNYGINLIIDKNRTIPSINVGLLIGLI
jgi:hypothetical protein